MKIKGLKTLLFCALPLLLWAQEPKIWEGDLYAQDFEAFKEGSYTDLKGSLKVYDTKLDNLLVLSSLQKIEGDIHIGLYDSKKDLDAGNAMLQSLKGLHNLKEVSGQINIRKNKLLEDISDLKGLKKATRINISQNPLLKKLKGLHNISGILPEGLQLYKNKRLRDISQLSKITLVGDHLVVSSNLSLESLEGLHNIKAIENGHLSIRNNNYLKNLSGLRKIQSVGDRVHIRENPLLKNLEGLEKLASVGKYVDITGNEGLENLQGLSSLASVGDDLEIKNNNALLSIEGIGSLSAVKGSLVIAENAQLRSIEGLNQIKGEVEGVYIVKNASLKKINGLNNIEQVTESVSVGENNLESLIGFDKLRTIGKNLQVKWKCDATNVFNNLSEVGNFYVRSEIAVLDCSTTFKKLTRIKHYFYLYDTKLLEEFIGPNTIQEIGEGMILEENEKLNSFGGFKGLKAIGKNMEINKNVLLQKVSGFEGLEKVVDIRIDDNPALEYIQGFENLEHLKNLWIDDNASFKGLSGFDKLTTVNDLFLRENRSLESLSGFKNLQEIREDLRIYDNDALLSLEGLENISHIGKYIDIRDNYKLEDFDGLQDDMLQSRTENEIEISGNSYNPNIDQLLIHDHLDNKLIPESYLESKDRWELALLRNEIFARRGYDFGNNELTDYFSEQGWYEPNESVEIVLNETEEQNVDLIRNHEKKRIDYAITALKKLKERCKNEVFFSSDYEEYNALLKGFIEAIDLGALKKSNKLFFAKEYLFNKEEVLSLEHEDEEPDKIYVDADNTDGTINISIENNYLEKSDYDEWMATEIVSYEFSIAQDGNIELMAAYGDYH